MPTKSKTKRTAKRAKVKPKPPKPLPQSYGPGWPQEVAHLKEEAEAAAERYWRPWRDPKLKEGRASLVRYLAERDIPQTQRDNPKTQPAAVQTLGPQAAQAFMVLGKLFPEDKYPDGVPRGVTTKALVPKIGRWMKLNALQREIELLPAPQWDAVKAAREEFNRMRMATPSQSSGLSGR
jgi:hypothetical protein